MTSSGWSMLGRNAMTLARIATARRQIANNAIQSPGRSRPSGDSVSRRPAVKMVIAHPLEDFGRRGLAPPRSRSPGSDDPFVHGR